MYDKTCYTIIELNSQIFVYEDDTWAVKGCYENALEDNDDAMWTFDEGQGVLCVIIVSEQYILFIYLLKFIQLD